MQELKKYILIILLIFISLPLFPKEISFILTGDILPGSDIEPEKPFVITDKYLPNLKIFSSVRSILRSGDITIGNLEGVMCDPIYLPVYKGENSYNFRIPPYAAKILKSSGFDVLNVANNHSLDCTRDGLINMVHHLNKSNIKICGLYKSNNSEIDLPEKLILKPIIIKRKKLKIIVLGFTTSRFFKSINSPEKYISIIKNISKKCDILVVTFHGGAERENSHRVFGKTEFFHNEKRGNVYRFAHDAIDNGADIVFGHGPHVLRGMEIYKNRIIAYSLGDFCGNNLFKKVFKTEGRRGISAILKIKVNSNGSFVTGKLYSISIKEKGIPVIDNKKIGLKFIRELSRIDFPKSTLKIDNFGKLTIK